MRRSTPIPSLFALALCLAPTQAQELGRGSLGPNGLEPRLRIQGAASPNTARLEVLDLPAAQGSSPALHLVFGAGRGRLPLDSLGLPGAIFGLDLSWTSLVGPFHPTTGTLGIDVPVVPAVEGVPLHVQAYYVDARIQGSAPIALSDSRTFTLGSDVPVIVALRAGNTPGTSDLVRFLADGRAAAPLPDLTGLFPLPLSLASVSEERHLRPDLPSIDRGGFVRLPNGSRLLHYRKASNGWLGLCHVQADGTVRILLEIANANPAEPSFEGFVAASPHGPYIAFAVQAPLPVVYLYRTDGENLPGLAEPLADVTPPFALDLEGASLVFGRDVLAAMDQALGISLVDLDTLNVARVNLPPTSAGVPLVHDEEVGVSADGRSFVFGAGPTRRLKDVYVVRDDGTAINVTNALADYGEVGYGDPGRLSELTLNEDGSRVGYVSNSTPEPEAFLRTISQPSALHMTENQTFSESIDVGAIGRLPGLTAAAILYAGSTVNQLDVFYTPTGQRQDIVNLTASGPNPQQRPFGLGGTLTLRDLGTTRSGAHPVVEAFDAARGQGALYHLDLANRTSRLAQTGVLGPRVSFGNGTSYAAAAEDRLAILDPTLSAANWRQELSFPGRIVAIHVRGDRQRLLLEVAESPSVDSLWLVDPVAGTSLPFHRPLAPIVDVLHEHEPGFVHVIVQRGGGTELVRVPTGGGAEIPTGWTGLQDVVTGF